MNEMMKKTAAALTANGFEVQCFETAAEARDYVLGQIPEGATIGIGGSVTVRELGLGETLRDNGHTVYWHWFNPGDREILVKANAADVYLASSNAVTTSGILVNIDGTGNRVAAMAFGPKKVFLIVGENKLVEGGIPTAIARIKREACPPNARRLNKDYPCALTGSCDAANCKKGMCNVTSIIDKPTGGHPMTIVLVAEKLGY